MTQVQTGHKLELSSDNCGVFTGPDRDPMHLLSLDTAVIVTRVIECMQIGRDIFTASSVLHDQLGENRVCTKLHCRKWCHILLPEITVLTKA